MNNKFTLLAFLFLFISNTNYGQITFTRQYGDVSTEAIFGMCKSNYDNGFVFCGRTTYSSNPKNFIASKINMNGDTLWTRIITNTVATQGNDAVQTSDSGFVIVGDVTVGANTDVLLMKVNKNGAVQWTKTYDYGTNTDVAMAIAQSPDGNLYITGYTTGSQEDVFLLKLGKTGNIKWAKKYTSPYRRWGQDLTLTSDGAVVIGGYTKDSVVTTSDFLLYKVDTVSGNKIWARSFIGSANNGIYGIVESSSNELVVTGITEQYVVGLRSTFLAKFNLAGNFLLMNSYGDCASTIGNDLVRGAPGEFLLSGYVLPCGGSALYTYLIKTDAAGNVLWNKIYGNGTDSHLNYALARANDGGYLLASTSSTGSNSDDAHMIKTDANGVVSCQTNTTAITTLTCNPVFYNTTFTVISGGVTTQTFSPTLLKVMPTNTLCTTLNAAELAKVISVSVYPNPFVKNITLKLNETYKTIQKIEFTDILGRQLEIEDRWVGNDMMSIAPKQEDLNEGVYFIKVVFNDQSEFIQKIIKTN